MFWSLSSSEKKQSPIYPIIFVSFRSVPLGAIMAIEPWNDRSIKQPVVYTSLCHEPKDVETLRGICEDIIRVLSNQSHLHKESAILSRFLYKYDKKFRSDIGYRKFKKVNTSLRRYLTLNFMKDIDNFHSYLPSDNADEIFLPSRQMLEYILIRLLAFSKLMLRICVYAKQSAIFYLNRLKRGESYWMSLMPYAVLSRIWSLCRVLLQYSVTWYSKLFKCLNKLEYKGLPFLSPCYELPEDIEEWLDMKNFNDIGRFSWSFNKFIQPVSVLSDFEENDAFDIFEYVTNINSQIEKSSHDIADEILHYDEEKLQSNVSNIDYHKTIPIEQGETISREEYKSINLLEKTEHICKQNYVVNCKGNEDSVKLLHSIDNIGNIQDLKNFISNEETFRYNDSSESLTRHLSFMQWQALKISLSRLCDVNSHSINIVQRIHKIWKNKCLDCQ